MKTLHFLVFVSFLSVTSAASSCQSDGFCQSNLGQLVAMTPPNNTVFKLDANAEVISFFVVVEASKSIEVSKGSSVTYACPSVSYPNSTLFAGLTCVASATQAQNFPSKNLSTGYKGYVISAKIDDSKGIPFVFLVLVSRAMIDYLSDFSLRDNGYICMSISVQNSSSGPQRCVYLNPVPKPTVGVYYTRKGSGRIQNASSENAFEVYVGNGYIALMRSDENLMLDSGMTSGYRQRTTWRFILNGA